jgi:putative pyruvate formate lyase activating enzyme
LDGLVDIYLPDFKVWKSATGKRLLKAEDYTPATMESIKAMHAQVGDLCFTADGIAKKGVLVRHLVMPNLVDEGKEIVKWLAENVSKDMMVHIMDQYFPRANVGKPRRATKPERGPGSSPTKAKVRYEDINRPTEIAEIAAVRAAAEGAGLWRFVEAARHGGFNI